MSINSDVQHLDLHSLQSYLAAQTVELGELRSARKFSDGQSNPTFLLTTDREKFVLRKKPPGLLLKSAHAVEREYRVMHALADSGVPVPRMLHLCEDESVLGTPFFIMEFLDGQIYWNPALPDLEPEKRFQVYRAMANLLAAVHSVEVNTVGLAEFGRPGNYYQRQVDRWIGQYRSSETITIPAMDELCRWLPLNIPVDDGEATLVHGDFRLDNMIFANDRIEVIGLLDWELSTLGHPYADLAYQCMQLRMDHTGAIAGLGGLDRNALGIPDEQCYVNMYCEARHIGEIPHWGFYIAFSAFRFAAILQGVHKRALDGNASSERAAEMGELVAPLAAMGAGEINGN